MSTGLAGKTLITTYTSLLKLEEDQQTLLAGGNEAIQVMTGDNEATPIHINTDRIGILTDAPTSTLHILGTLRVTGAVTLGDDIILSGASYATTVSYTEPTENRAIQIPNALGNILCLAHDSLGDWQQEVPTRDSNAGEVGQLIFDNMGGANPAFLYICHGDTTYGRWRRIPVYRFDDVPP